MASKYNTGGVVAPSNKAGSWGDMGCDHMAASTGTTYHNPNVKDDAKPGGYGSSGTGSKSKPKGGM